jgi:hypothetical protein
MAALLSLLIVSTPMSAAACDLSCWLRPSHSACHTIGSATEDQETPRSARSGMDMTSSVNRGSMNMACERTERGARLSQRVNKARSVHSMYPQVALATKRLAHNTKPKLSSAALHSDSAAFSSCGHEACSQTLISASPPGASRCQPNSSDSVATPISIQITLGTAFHLIKPQISPPKALPDDFATILRI